MNKRLVFATVVTGFNGMVIQLLLLREMLVVFHGNDLAIGVVFANWLAIEAFGAYFLGKRIERAKRRTSWFITVSILFTILAPVAIFLTRMVRELAGVMPGVGMGVLPIFYSSFFILLLPSLLHGALFVFTCKLCSQAGEAKGVSNEQNGASSIGWVYVWETIGHILGAVVFTFLMVLFFNSFTIVLAAGALTIIACIALLNFRQGMSSVAAITLLFAILIIHGVLLFSDIDNKLHYKAIAKQWPNQEVVHYQHSLHGNVAVIEREGEFTFITDGIPVITTPTPDIVRVEEFVHFPMLTHPNPQNVAILGGGAGGVITEILKYPSISRVDYTEMDPLLISLVKKFSTPMTEAELSDPRVNTLLVDGRRFMKLTDQKYDLIFVGASNPENLEVNRYFTAEFASLVKSRLAPGGIMVISLPGSLTYMGGELKNLNKVIINTLKSVFPYLHVIPGDYNILMASNTNDATLINAGLIYQRLSERQIESRLITFPYLDNRLAQRWLDWFWMEVELDATEEINSDFRPKGFFYSLAYWNAMFNPDLRKFFAQLERLNTTFFIILFGIGTIALLLLGRFVKRSRGIVVPYSVATTGFAGMAFDLVLIFAFQALFGFVFHWVGLLLAAFMAGAFVGGLVMTRVMHRIKSDRQTFITIEIAVGLFAIVLPLAIILLAPHLENPVLFFIGQLCFLLLALVAGTLTGLKFPLANKLYLARSNDVSRSAGLLYGIDLLGGWAGGLIVAVVLLPVLGLVGTSLVVIMIKASSLVMLLAFNPKRL